MKKLFFLMALAGLLLSCEGPMGPQGPVGPIGQAGTSTQWNIIDLTILTNQWVLDYAGSNNTNPYYYANFDIPEIDNFIYDSGLTMCYIEFNKGQDNRTQQILPYTRHFEGYDENAAQFIWTRTVDYEFSKGRVTIFVTFSDFYMDEKPETMDFRLVLVR